MTMQGVPALDTGGDEGFGRKRFREIPLALLLLAPSLIIFGLFVFYPLGQTVWLGFYRSDPFGGSQEYVGFDQYRDVLGSSDFHHSLWVTFQFAFITVGLGLVLGLALAVLAHQRIRGIAVFRTIFSSTVATSVAVASLMWLVLFHPSIGVFNQFLDVDRPREAGAVAARPRHGPVRRRRHHGLAEPRLHLHHPHRRAAGHPRRPLRERPGRRGQRLAAVPGRSPSRCCRPRCCSPA